MSGTDFRDVWGLAKTDPDWPERLLHVDSWTSFVRRDNNSYNGVVEPQYNILSYTWGRWMLDRPGPALSLRGIEWDVPAVDPKEAFSVEQFQTVIKRVAHGVEFVWVDIACIHQNDRPAKMKEIGRQASIFEGAENAFVWLHQWSDDQMKTNIKLLNDAWLALDEDMVYASDIEEDDSFDDNDAPVCFADGLWVDSVIRSLEMWRSEPWFTSLWTLEEMYLKSSATFLSRTGNTAELDGEVVGLAWLLRCVNTIEGSIRALYDERPFPTHLNEAKLNQISVGVDQLGASDAMWTNSCVVFAATRHRQVWDPLDRVYGIMQVFGFQLGESIDPDGKYTLPQLKLQLVAKMAERNPIFSQFFLHAQCAPSGFSWMIGDHSWTPLRLSFSDLRPLTMCEINVDEVNATASFKGPSQLFRDFAAMYKKAFPLHGGEAWQTWQDIMFDADPALLEFLPEDIVDQNRIQLSRFHGVAEMLSQAFGDRLRLLSLGVLQDAGHDKYMNDDDDDPRDLGIGILALLKRSDDGHVSWRRVGLCIWQETNEDSEHFEEFEAKWEQFFGTFC